MKNKAKKISVIDDDLSIGEIVAAILELEGYVVNSYNSGKEGIEGAKKQKPDMILLDYFLPGENAQDVVLNLRGLLGEDLPIILMSASRQAEEFAKNMKIDEFIAKPFHREGLLDAVERHLK